MPETVAIPLLENSPVFTDEDLIELVLAVTTAKQAAIAARATVSGALTEVICEHAGYGVYALGVRFLEADLKIWINTRPVANGEIERRIKQCLIKPAIHQVQKPFANICSFQIALLDKIAGILAFPTLDHCAVEFADIFEKPIEPCSGQIECFRQGHDFHGIDAFRNEQLISSVEPELF